jgi:Cu-Zn family superoxide dismutase
MMRSPRWLVLAALAALLSLTVGVVASSGKSGSGGDDKTSHGKSGSSGGHRSTVFTIPGNTVFPEGIALDRRRSGKTFFVSSTTDGTIFKGNVKNAAMTVFAPGGADGRTTAAGMTIDRGRLFVSGADTGKMFVLSTADGHTLKVLDTQHGSTPTFINDVTVGGGFAYFTDSLRPIVWRASTRGATIGDIQPWLDLTGTPFVYQNGFNANGIVNYADGHILVIVQSNTGKLFRIDTARKAVTQIDLGGKTVVNGDGLLAHGSHLYVVQNADNQITEVKLRNSKRAGRVGNVRKSSLFAFPTTAARDGSRLLVVNSQFNNRGPGLSPVLPFTVVSVKQP